MNDNILRLVGEKQGENSFSEHTIIYKGDKLKLDIKPSPCGFDVIYYRELSKEEKERNPFVMMMGDRQKVYEEHIHPKWWWKYTFKTPEKEIAKRIKFVKDTFRELEKNEKIIDGLKL